MPDDPSAPEEPESELLRQIREGRTFSLADAIGMAGGGDLMKGASPVGKDRQAAIAIGHYLESHLPDGEGALRRVLLRHVEGSERLLSSYGRPLEMLAGVCRDVLGSEASLRDLVRDADAEWGRMYHTRPRFDVTAGDPHADDPYTQESVRMSLMQLIKRIEEGSTADGRG